MLLRELLLILQPVSVPILLLPPRIELTGFSCNQICFWGETHPTIKASTFLYQLKVHQIDGAEFPFIHLPTILPR
jgi:hypothetical protein